MVWVSGLALGLPIQSGTADSAAASGGLDTDQVDDRTMYARYGPSDFGYFSRYAS
jgi:hypothetical protein